jgi:thioredoxin-like negative regulator of GroEL
MLHIRLKADVTDILNTEQLEQLREETKTSQIPLVIDFQKSKCKPCLRIAPDFAKMAELYGGAVQFAKVDADESRDHYKAAVSMMKGNSIRAVPSFQVWRDGEKVDHVSGAHLDQLENIIRAVLKEEGKELPSRLL